MALYKPVTQDDGVVTSYHRILRIESVINSHTSIVVLSYIDQESRMSESNEYAPYRTAITYETDYVENMTIEDAYNYLKTTPSSICEDATDI